MSRVGWLHLRRGAYAGAAVAVMVDNSKSFLALYGKEEDRRKPFPPDELGTLSPQLARPGLGDGLPRYVAYYHYGTKYMAHTYKRRRPSYDCSFRALHAPRTQ